MRETIWSHVKMYLNFKDSDVAFDAINGYEKYVVENNIQPSKANFLKWFKYNHTTTVLARYREKTSIRYIKNGIKKGINLEKFEEFGSPWGYYDVDEDGTIGGWNTLKYLNHYLAEPPMKTYYEKTNMPDRPVDYYLNDINNYIIATRRNSQAIDNTKVFLDFNIIKGDFVFCFDYRNKKCYCIKNRDKFMEVTPVYDISFLYHILEWQKEHSDPASTPNRLIDEAISHIKKGFYKTDVYINVVYKPIKSFKIIR